MIREDVDRPLWSGGALILVAVAVAGRPVADGQSSGPNFELVQPDLFGAPGGQPNAWADFNNDGQLDEFVGFRGRPNRLYRQDHGHFSDVAAAVGIADTVETRVAAWGDYDNDGRPDLYVAGFLAAETHYPDHLFHNDGGRFHDVIPQFVRDRDASHGVQWVDFDNDGALDLALTNNDAAGGHYLFRNRLPADQTRRSLSVDVIDARGRHTKPGAKVRVYRAGAQTLISSGLVGSGGGYCSQNVMPVRVATAGADRVDVEVTTMSRNGRKVTKTAGVDPLRAARPLVIKTD